MITLAHYWKGRDTTYGLQLGTGLRTNAARTVELANELLKHAVTAGVVMTLIPGTSSLVTSGWRPSDINATTKNASKTSFHITCEAIDLHDPHGCLGDWLLTEAGLKVLKDLGLWLEDPSFTDGWVHVQTKPPPSQRRVFQPRATP